MPIYLYRAFIFAVKGYLSNLNIQPPPRRSFTSPDNYCLDEYCRPISRLRHFDFIIDASAISIE
jgi:hypothetical protein